jgi:hypothetical protein
MESLPQSPTTPSFTEHIEEPRHMTLEIQVLAWDRPTIYIKEYRRGNQKWQSRETGNIGYTIRRYTQTQHNMCRTPLHASKHIT